MYFALWSVLIASLLPIVLSWVSGYHRNKQFGSVDNKNPRAQAGQLTGAGARAVAAQQNGWEALAMWAPAVLVAHIAGAGHETMNLVAAIFVTARVLHALCYLANQDILRSLVWLVGLGASIAMYVIAA